MGTAGAEHEGIHAHAHVLPLGLDALPDEHAGALDAAKGAGLRADLVVVTALQIRRRVVTVQAMRTAIEVGQGCVAIASSITVAFVGERRRVVVEIIATATAAAAAASAAGDVRRSYQCPMGCGQRGRGQAID